jgi:hypothetical protein
LPGTTTVRKSGNSIAFVTKRCCEFRGHKNLLCFALKRICKAAVFAVKVNNATNIPFFTFSYWSSFEKKEGFKTAIKTITARSELEFNF